MRIRKRPRGCAPVHTGGTVSGKKNAPIIYLPQTLCAQSFMKGFLYALRGDSFWQAHTIIHSLERYGRAIASGVFYPRIFANLHEWAFKLA
jgi:hypothetical protein